MGFNVELMEKGSTFHLLGFRNGVSILHDALCSHWILVSAAHSTNCVCSEQIHRGNWTFFSAIKGLLLLV